MAPVELNFPPLASMKFPANDFQWFNRQSPRGPRQNLVKKGVVMPRNLNRLIDPLSRMRESFSKEYYCACFAIQNMENSEETLSRPSDLQ
jgi:hypothetical protein